MSVFNVYEHPAKGPDGTVLIREGFTPRAFVFTVLWALWHRMWIVAAGLVFLLSSLALAVIYLGLPPVAAAILNLGLAVLFGLEAGNLRGLGLRWAGFRETAVIAAETLEEAELEHAIAQRSGSVDRRPVVPRTPPPIQAPSDTLGLFGNV